ncbi:NAD(P)H-dependent glycerol-3-phosphate dehydrogenase [Rudanella paleaurantiibacter]|uniref:Glycerol-3-phosphate dehydrogenase n=1 Tax=Rudanella paleaurantiibacter TaxID=2614655 RepID=A0A7J5U5N1_9BACT|nr:NAD(P)H-dependent glycerol-3-phosphate dehydrogenase [Rudanella paleaurantiibacter]KAB7732887.1 NAD(P)H-dependent glycerol-3-phosphate dehydrogenase [Rudanella paleaurantiibacter]
MKHDSPVRITMVGGGSWATALIKILSENNVSIKWWMRSKTDANHIKTFHHNKSYLSDVQINPRKVKVCTRVRDAFRESEYVILAVPAAFVSDALAGLDTRDFTGKCIISAIKGMIPEKNQLVTDWVADQFGVPNSRMAVIAGPCHAEEVALEKQSYLTIGSTDLECAAEVARLLTCRFVQASPLADIYGIEYSAVMKNIIALASGITRGIGYGDNFQAVLVSNAMQEIKRFVDAVYPQHRDLSASAYLGDLLVTAYSPFSRNRTFGTLIGRGYTIQSAQAEMNMIAEGYYAVKSIHAINRQHNVDMPITDAVYNILYERASPVAEMKILQGKLT